MRASKGTLIYASSSNLLSSPCSWSLRTLVIFLAELIYLEGLRYKLSCIELTQV